MSSFIIEFLNPPRANIHGQVKYVAVESFEIGETTTSFVSDSVIYYLPTRNIISIEVCDIEPEKGDESLQG